jgi:transposase InsO family protein
VLGLIKAAPGNVSLETMLVEISKLEAIRVAGDSGRHGPRGDLPVVGGEATLQDLVAEWGGETFRTENRGRRGVSWALRGGGVKLRAVRLGPSAAALHQDEALALGRSWRPHSAGSGRVAEGCSEPQECRVLVNVK